MGRAGLHCLPGPRKSRLVLPKLTTAGDMVRREFSTDNTDQLWVTDITEHPTREGKVYCCVVLDMFSRKVVGWSIDSSQTAAPATNALGMAIGARRPPEGAVFHSDHGVQFTSWAFTQRALASGLLPSMGAVRSCYDNAVVEAFWPDAGRVAQPAPLEDQARTPQRGLRVPRDLPQLPTSPQRPRKC